jgi:hypothetical protein
MPAEPVPPWALELGRRFVSAIVEHDWVGVASCFEPGAQFRAVIPNETRPFREHVGGAATTDQIRRWFGDADVTELIDSSVEEVADCVAIRYRIHEHEADGWYLVEQVAFATPGGRAFAALNLVCSGFRAVAE